MQLTQPISLPKPTRLLMTMLVVLSLSYHTLPPATAQVNVQLPTPTPTPANVSDQVNQAIRTNTTNQPSDATPQDPPASDWPMWRRSHNAFGYSPLTEITRDNVTELNLAWEMPLNPGPNMATPLVHNGIMYLLSIPDIVLALDASNGEELWRYQHELSTPPSAKMGMALHDNKLIVPTSDMHILALNASNGELLWDHTITTPPTPAFFSYSLRGAPLVAGDMVVQGITATMLPEGGFIIGLDLETGTEAWRFHTVARPDEPGGNTWNNISLAERSGGSVWVSGSYDPELDLAYFGAAPTYDTAPLLPNLNITGVSNDALYTNTTLALRPATGELAWHFQHVANDQWDLDWTYERTIIEMNVDGNPRKVVLTAGKMALLDALDAATGEYLFSIDSGLQNVITAIDPETGAKTIDPASQPSLERPVMICPFANGGRNWQASVYNPETDVLYLPISDVCMDGSPAGGDSVLTTGRGSILSTGVALTPAPLPNSDGMFGRLQAINMKTRSLSWDFRQEMIFTAGLVATGGNLIFSGSLDGSFQAFDAETGELLWSTPLGDIPTSFPTTYSVDGKQYVSVVIGQPSIHANVFIGTMQMLLGPGNVLETMSRTGAAIKVFAL
ncbi:MAG: pyrroloquinoline quinone-dependent dehydrogenase [Pseudohongiellaceae bacterium]